MDLNDEGAVLPLLLRVPVDAARHAVLVPALWSTEVQDWELKCMNGLVLDESRHGPGPEQREKQKSPPSNRASAGKEKQNASAPSEGGNAAGKVPGAKSVLTRVLRLAQRYLSDPMGRQRDQEKAPQTQPRPRQQSPAAGRLLRSRTPASLTRAQMRSRRRSQQQRGGARQPAAQGDVTSPPVAPRDATGCGKTERSEQPSNRSDTGPVGKAARRRSNHSIIQHVRVKSLRLLRNGKSPLKQTPPLSSSSSSSSVPPPSLRSSDSTPRSSPAPRGGEQRDTPRTALIKELSSKHQTSVPFGNARESKLI
ncbi:serine/arginine repetitive matrix protein 2-like [Brachyistius frenatus]|uniref:serine/arginine repetitive matrix protein 2-like n=1 Tax=Brachyistius frenatus TaxID=100188 RepID=UPI0037E874D3